MSTPRLGQWVLWSGRAAIFCGDGAGTAASSAGPRRVGVWDASLKAFVPRVLPPADVPADKGIIDLVADSGATEASLLVALAELSAITDPAQIPAARRATAPAGWVPGGAGADRRMSDWGFNGGAKRAPEASRAVHDLVDAWTSARWSSDSARMAELEAQIQAAGAWVRVRG